MTFCTDAHILHAKFASVTKYGAESLSIAAQIQSDNRKVRRASAGTSFDVKYPFRGPWHTNTT